MEYPPLLTSGLHDFRLDEISQHFVTPFADPARREYLLGRFILLLSEINQGSGIEMELWLDGSFATEKPDPEDIDVVFWARLEDLSTRSFEQQQFIQKIFVDSHEDTKLRYKCDVYLGIQEREDMRKYWLEWFGRSREGVEKGIVRIL